MPERRFRDMRLTTDDMWSRIGDHIGRNYDPDGYGYSKQCARLEARAKRLLPLWRDIGLRELSKSIGESPLGRLEYKGQWASWLDWFKRSPLEFPADYNIVFRVTQPRKKRVAQ